MPWKPTEILLDLWFSGRANKNLPKLSKKRRELSLEEEVDARLSKSSELDSTTINLFEHGFERVLESDYSTDQDVEELFVKVDGDARPFVEVEVIGKKIVALLDSGAQRTVLGAGSEKFIRELR